MKVLLTGGAGYIGSVTTAAVIQAGHPVVIVDNLSLGHRAAVHPEAVLVEADLSDRQHTAAIIAEHRPAAIMHLARMLQTESICWKLPSATASVASFSLRRPICSIIRNGSQSRRMSN